MNSTLPLMMKLILSLIVIWAFTSTAGAIMCKRCSDFDSISCGAEDINCPNDNACITAYSKDTSQTPEVERIYKNCASDDVCPSAGVVEFSGTLGGGASIAYGLCCDSDFCNTGVVLPFPPIPNQNNFECRGCDPPTAGCPSTVPCLGQQNTCFTASVIGPIVSSSLSGCATSNFCNTAVSFGFLPFFSDIGEVTIAPTCYPASPPAPATAPPPQQQPQPPPATPTSPPPVANTTRPPRPNVYNHYNYYGGCGCRQGCYKKPKGCCKKSKSYWNKHHSRKHHSGHHSGHHKK